MDAVIWLEDYLAEWTKILFFVSHSQDFMNSVCTHIVRLDAKYKKLRYYRLEMKVASLYWEHEKETPYTERRAALSVYGELESAYIQKAAAAPGL